MNMKAFKYKIAVLCFSALTTVSCSDFLQEDPRGQMTNLESFTENQIWKVPFMHSIIR